MLFSARSDTLTCSIVERVSFLLVLNPRDCVRVAGFLRLVPPFFFLRNGLFGTPPPPQAKSLSENPGARSSIVARVLWGEAVGSRALEGCSMLGGACFYTVVLVCIF